jgi:hypothetical protein
MGAKEFEEEAEIDRDELLLVPIDSLNSFFFLFRCRLNG